MSVSTKWVFAYAHAALAWALGTLALASAALIQAGDAATTPSRLVLGGLFLTFIAFCIALYLGYRSSFALGTEMISHKLRRLSGAVAGLCFMWAWGLCAIAYASGGPAEVHSLIRHSMPSTIGVALGVVGATSGCLFLWESAAAVFEVRGAARKKGVVIATLLAFVAATACVAALSSVVVGRTYFFGAS